MSTGVHEIPAEVPASLEAALRRLAPEARANARPTSGYLDVSNAEEPDSTGMFQDLMLGGFVPRIYERWWRPALSWVATFGVRMAEEHQIARALLDLRPGDVVLDAACGTGAFTRDFASAVGPSGNVVGVDISESMLERAVRDARRAGLDHVGYVRGDAQELPFLPGSFDKVCCFAALYILEDPMRALDRMADVLAPGGRLALFVTALRWRSAPVRTVASRIASRTGAQLFDPGELAAALACRGFTDIHQRITGIMQFVGARRPGNG